MYIPRPTAPSAGLNSFRALGAEDLWVPSILGDPVKFRLSGPCRTLGAHPKCPMDKTALKLRHLFLYIFVAAVAKWSRYRIVAGVSRVRTQYHQRPAV
ncbi:hypothetical protein TNCV_199601 [Trichonephila clavipes]|nr:hypothetical protein TNCV_199601 [Trichonephila clavipes]